MVRYELFCLGRTWNDEYGTADDPERAGLAAVVLPVPPRAGRGRVPGRAVHRLRLRHPGRPAARPQDVRGPAARHRGRARRRGPCCCAARPTSVTAPGRSAAPSRSASTSCPSSPHTPGWRRDDARPSTAPSPHRPTSPRPIDPPPAERLARPSPSRCATDAARGASASSSGPTTTSSRARRRDRRQDVHDHR